MGKVFHIGSGTILLLFMFFLLIVYFVSPPLFREILFVVEEILKTIVRALRG